MDNEHMDMIGTTFYGNEIELVHKFRIWLKTHGISQKEILKYLINGIVRGEIKYDKLERSENSGKV